MTTFGWIGKRIRRYWDGLAVRLEMARAPRSVAAPSEWLRRPTIEADDNLCLFVAYAPEGQVLEHSLYHAQAWAAAGFRVIIIAVVDRLDAVGDQFLQPLDFADGVLVRENAGHDFGAWAAAITGLSSDLSHIALLATVNDSLYGPLRSFGKMIHQARAADADVIGVVESLQFIKHYQSYLLFFKPAAVQSQAFSRFWRGVRNVRKDLVIRRYELLLRDRMSKAGLRCLALFPASVDGPVNPALFGWHTLVKRGFPFVKVTTIRADPGGESISGWQDILLEEGYDPGIVRRHLLSLDSNSASLQPVQLNRP